MNRFGKRFVTKSIGVVGGLGPETTAEFYLNLIKDSRRYLLNYPKIIISSVPFPFFLENEIIFKSRNERKILSFLEKSIVELNKLNVDFIVIPCNTVHIFIKLLRKKSDAPIINIVDETVKFVKEHNYATVGILATNKTIDSKLYESPLRNENLKVILPRKKEQTIVARIILRLLSNKNSNHDKLILNRLIKSLEKRGAEVIILGCTDLQLILKQNNFKIPIIDSMIVLEKTVFKKICEG